MDRPSDRHDKRNLLAVNLALIANAGLAALRTAIGILGHSPALLADGINSTSDVAYGIIVKVFIRKARKPADDEHPYGHRQLESIAAVVIGAFVLTTAVAIFWDAITGSMTFSPRELPSQEPAAGAQFAAVFTVGLKILLSWRTRRIGRQTGNPVVLAIASDHPQRYLRRRGRRIGIFVARHGYPWFDPLAGAVVALVILRTGLQILRESSGDLMDTVALGGAQEKGRGLCGRNIRSVGRRGNAGAPLRPVFRHQSDHRVDGSVTVAEGDAISALLESVLHQDIDLLQRVHVHYHPLSAASQGSPPGIANT